ncbi:MAG: hypothetical protein ACLSDQ_10660, partial [Adlercreutzia equolifaciens]
VHRAPHVHRCVGGYRNADPQALLVAEAAFKSAEVIGYPECRINLAQAAVYLALAPKSNAAEAGIDAALAEVRNGPARAVPDHLRDRHRPGSENYGAYRYPHSYPSGWVEQRYLPDGLERGCFSGRAAAAGAYRADAARDSRETVWKHPSGENPRRAKGNRSATPVKPGETLACIDQGGRGIVASKTGGIMDFMKFST